MSRTLRSPRLLPGERKALAQEMLLQQHQFRENQALLHGLSPPEPAVVIGEEAEIAPDSVTDVRMSKSVERIATVMQEAITTPADSTTAEAIDRATDTLSAKKPATPMPVWKKAALTAALLGSGVTVPYVGNAIWGNAAKPPVAVQTVDPPGATSGDLLYELERRGYAVAPTDLGGDIKRAFKMDPSLRNKLIEDVKNTLEQHGVRAHTAPIGSGNSPAADSD